MDLVLATSALTTVCTLSRSGSLLGEGDTSQAFMRTLKVRNYAPFEQRQPLVLKYLRINRWAGE